MTKRRYSYCQAQLSVLLLFPRCRSTSPTPTLVYFCWRWNKRIATFDNCEQLFIIWPQCWVVGHVGKYIPIVIRFESSSKPTIHWSSFAVIVKRLEKRIKHSKWGQRKERNRPLEDLLPVFNQGITNSKRQFHFNTQFIPCHKNAQKRRVVHPCECDHSESACTCSLWQPFR